MKVRSQTRLARRGAVYYFRAKIPSDLKLHFGRKREIMESLKTSNKREAEQLVRTKSVELDNHFAELRRQQHETPKTKISEADIARIVAKATATRMKADEEGRILGLSDEDFTRHLKWLEDAEANGSAAVARGRFEGLQMMIDDWLGGHGFDLQKDSEGYRKFAFEFAKAQMRVNQQLRARDRGEPIDTPEMPAETKGGAFKLSDLCDYWKKQKNPRPKTIIEADSVLRRFAAVNGELPPAKVQRRHIVAFRDALVEEGAAPGTVKKLLGLLSGMFQVAVEDEQFGIETNPVRDVKVRGRVGESKARKPFNVEELNAIFASPVFAKGERPQAGAGEAAYWLPLVGLFTGARLNEIGQLRTGDVKTADGITFIHFTDQGEGQRLKKGSKSRKRVPVHAQLVRLGLLRYVEKMREEKQERLFPDLKADSHGHITGRWSRWFNRYLDGVVGIADPEKDFHSFRHTFKLTARACGIPEDQHDALTGHANVSVSRAYGGTEGYPLGQLAKAIKRLRFQELRI
jgi:integrase